MSLVAVAPSDLTQAEAEHLSMRIGLRLDTIADNYAAVMPMIREAIERNAHGALGYASPGAFISERFGDSLSKLGAELRKEVTRELADAGLSTRAIAPVLSVSQRTVVRDLESAGESHDSPDPEPIVHPVTGEILPEESTVTETHTVKIVQGLDGKSYPKLPPAPKAEKPMKVQNAEQFAAAFSESLYTLAKASTPEGRMVILESWAVGLEAATPVMREYVNPTWFRAIASGLNALANKWEN